MVNWIEFFGGNIGRVGLCLIFACWLFPTAAVAQSETSVGIWELSELHEADGSISGCVATTNESNSNIEFGFLMSADMHLVLLIHVEQVGQHELGSWPISYLIDNYGPFASVLEANEPGLFFLRIGASEQRLEQLRRGYRLSIFEANGSEVGSFALTGTSYALEALRNCVVQEGLSGVARSRPESGIDPFGTQFSRLLRSDLPYLEQVAFLRTAISNGEIIVYEANTVGVNTEAAAIDLLELSNVGRQVLPTTTAIEIEEEGFVWWTTSEVGTAREIDLEMFVHNLSRDTVRGLILEMSDRTCEFSHLGNIRWYVVSIESAGELGPGRYAALNATIELSENLFENNGGRRFCISVRQAFH